ncbi:hypothetical protein Btru_060860 [Bulinus truncatus]|nr:hypothetical protein Btru_060860 [Bulinus truncatus]
MSCHCPADMSCLCPVDKSCHCPADMSCHCPADMSCHCPADMSCHCPSSQYCGCVVRSERGQVLGPNLWRPCITNLQVFRRYQNSQCSNHFWQYLDDENPKGKAYNSTRNCSNNFTTGLKFPLSLPGNASFDSTVARNWTVDHDSYYYWLYFRVYELYVSGVLFYLLPYALIPILNIQLLLAIQEEAGGDQGMLRRQERPHQVQRSLCIDRLTCFFKGARGGVGRE